MKLVFLVFFSVIVVLTLGNGRELTVSSHQVEFVVMGDMPSLPRDKVTLQKLQVLIPQFDKQPDVLIHYGDLISGAESCTDNLIKQRKAQMASFLPGRVVYTPGDNEWTDCDRKHLKVRFSELERLAYLRLLFGEDKNMTKDLSHLVRQKDLPENSMWRINGLQMGTLHIVGTNNGRVNILKDNVDEALDEADRRNHLNLVWLKNLFRKAVLAEGLVIIFHADIYRFKGDAPACSKTNRIKCNPYKNIRDAIETMAASYGKPVLIIHGDTNAYCFNQPLKETPNLWHFNGPGDFKVSDAAHIVFDPGNIKEPFSVRGILDPVKPPVLCNYNR